MISVVHFQYMSDGGEIAKRLVSSKKPFLASIVPDLLDKCLKTAEGEDISGRIHPENNYYPNWAVDFFRENKRNRNITWIQEGCRHCCGRCFNKLEKNRKSGKEWPDPFHEHVCLDGNTQSLEAQFVVMDVGRKLMIDKLGIYPEGYCPPNHLSNDNTLSAARKVGFEYFLTRDATDYFPLPRLGPYRSENGLIILPEARLGSRNPDLVFTYYDHLERGKLDEYLPILRDSRDLSKIHLAKAPFALGRINQTAIFLYKFSRDFRNRC